MTVDISSRGSVLFRRTVGKGGFEAAAPAHSGPSPDCRVKREVKTVQDIRSRQRRGVSVKPMRRAMMLVLVLFGLSLAVGYSASTPIKVEVAKFGYKLTFPETTPSLTFHESYDGNKVVEGESVKLSPTKLEYYMRLWQSNPGTSVSKLELKFDAFNYGAEPTLGYNVEISTYNPSVNVGKGKVTVTYDSDSDTTSSTSAIIQLYPVVNDVGDSKIGTNYDNWYRIRYEFDSEIVLSNLTAGDYTSTVTATLNGS